MTKEKYKDSNYKPDNNTAQEIQSLYKKNRDLSSLKLNNALLKG